MLAGHDLDKRRLAPADVPVGVRQAQRLAQAHAGLRQRLKQQPVAQRPPPLAPLALEAGQPSRIAATCAGVSTGGGPGAGVRNRKRARAPVAAALQVLEHRPVATRLTWRIDARASAAPRPCTSCWKR